MLAIRNYTENPYSLKDKSIIKNDNNPTLLGKLSYFIKPSQGSNGFETHIFITAMHNLIAEVFDKTGKKITIVGERVLNGLTQKSLLNTEKNYILANPEQFEAAFIPETRKIYIWPKLLASARREDTFIYTGTENIFMGKTKEELFSYLQDPNNANVKIPGTNITIGQADFFKVKRTSSNNKLGPNKLESSAIPGLIIYYDKSKICKNGKFEPAHIDVIFTALRTQVRKEEEPDAWQTKLTLNTYTTEIKYKFPIDPQYPAWKDTLKDFKSKAVLPENNVVPSDYTVHEPTITLTIPYDNASTKPLRVFSDGKYDGELRNGKRHGSGNFLWENGDCYDGDWQNDMRHGTGIYQSSDGRVYKGEWKEDKKHGKGKLVLVNGDKYEGEWANDMRHGKGTFIRTNGETTIGEWKNGILINQKPNNMIRGNINNPQNTFIRKIVVNAESNIDTNFKMIFPTGEYNGKLKNGKRHGVGIFILENGDRYEGSWEDDMINRYGRYDFANGKSYLGYWKNNKWHGWGKFIWPNGDTYEGCWKEGNFDGPGTYTFANGNKYEGQMDEDFMANSSGIFTYANGKIINCEWTNGQLRNKDQSINNDEYADIELNSYGNCTII